MLKYGAEKYDAPEEDLICCEVQDFDFKSFSEQVSLWFCWWNACYLNHTQLIHYLTNMMSTLRLPQQPAGSPSLAQFSGYIILAEPTGKETTINGFKGQSMAVRPASYYEQIFKDLNLDVIYFEDYESYKANETTTINEERVWLLKESPHSPWYKLGL